MAWGNIDHGVNPARRINKLSLQSTLQVTALLPIYERRMQVHLWDLRGTRADRAAGLCFQPSQSIVLAVRVKHVLCDFNGTLTRKYHSLLWDPKSG